ncbi:type I methionyl aminopeptidase [Chelatococcus asaccharovorans]|uniref:Methionine aminopeptidase n=1 Tax=Chelatococcus asaccharovorans TaxID=28210 RepID=A0A2V3UHQ8_9HYPH|nr:type I methionyl aminopeptidase [Chelatococcus asaccharovorans]MBS7701730.1 type I methionyl aminopeptidase [Chelatococcus asaccharovorans]PXW64563.1 methionine aminopeptidase type I [Chelatococcus asaccharovorans]
MNSQYEGLDVTLQYSTQVDVTGRPVPIHGEEAFAGMRRAGRLAAETLDFITPAVRAGVSTAELDALCEEFMRKAGAVPATIGYKGYRHASCISVNHVVTHGIPSDKLLSEGDILNIDVTPILDGWYGDSSRMYLVGEVPVKAARLVHTTYEAMMAGIAQVKPGNTLGDVGHAIETVALRERFSVVEDFCGHGLGQVFHDAPQVVHYGEPGTGVVLEPGMLFTIEPMLNAGKAGVKVLGDGWTAVTRDRSLSAQFEHTVGVTETGVEIFTLSPKGFTEPPYPAT